VRWAANRMVTGRGAPAPALNPWGNPDVVRNGQRWLTVTTDARTAENCARLAARLAGIAAAAACAHSVLTVTFPSARAGSHIEEGRSAE